MGLRLVEISVRAKGTEFRCLVFADRVVGGQEVERHLLHYMDETMVESLLREEEEERGENTYSVLWTVT